MPEIKTLSAITWRGLVVGHEYIALALDTSSPSQLGVYHVRIEDVHDQSGSDRIYEVRCLKMCGVPFFSADDSVRLFTLEDLGCPYKSSPVGLTCRMFPYGDVEHRMLLAHARENEASVRKWFSMPKVNITYEVSVPGRPVDQGTHRRSLWGGSALAGWTLRNG